MLKPHYGLKELKLRGYGGTKFPAWLGQSSFENLVVLRFKNCNQCTTLPSVGHLPSLKNLVIKGMAKVRSVGLEFIGKYCSEPFRSLETLCFEDMQEWEEWISHGGTAGGDQEAAKGFPRLRELSILSCSKLKALVWLLLLKEGCTNLSELILSRCRYLTALPNSMYNLSSLQRLEIRDCPRIASIPEEVGFPPNVRTLQIEGPNICKLFFDLGFHNLTSVRELFIAGGWEDEESFQQLPASLVKLYIREFPLGYLSFARNLTSLERLELRKCTILKSLPGNGLPPSLVFLSIYLCPYLEERCKKDEGEYWHLVADIPFVQLNHKLVFDPREFS
ncbi:hypothetical protein KPL71_009373 [Citrus sinensis]|uniref:Uncharacterized protein n=1 Tax=Citrus sinensis TaxID=2711 RepID=A0ACB8MDQ3_CITSI|nr:hypothetical protein KPL71_009373 [Citrus sinensis]